jgi:hypothetical protein
MGSGGQRPGVERVPDVTIGSVWRGIGHPLTPDVLAWPPDVFALVDRVLEASEAYRFVVSPPPGVDVAATGSGATTSAVAVEWWEWLDGRWGLPPADVVAWWGTVNGALGVGIDVLSAGKEWQVTDALLALHAVADEACAGLGDATAAPPGPGCAFRAAARELLSVSGSLSRLSPGVLRVLPRCRATTTGISIHSLARHVCVRGPQVDVEWHRTLSRPEGETLAAAHSNVVLLPWPLRVRARDFRPVPYTLPHMDTGEFGFFEFRPDEALDLDRVDAVLRAAADEAGAVDIVILPEAAVTPAEVAPLEAILAAHGCWCLITGVREPAAEAGALGDNWVHVGVRQHLVWRHARQHKHHRWCLDGRQINQYHLGGALSPKMRWWEAVGVSPRSLQICDMGAMTLAPLLCEDLARLEPVADVVRAIGPSAVVTLLLDGPQLASRWTARYASVLADDPGSAVLTLSCYGMVRRCRPPGCAPSNVVALWKDSTGGMVEIALEDGADAVLIATNVGFRDSVTADGRRHPATTSEITLVATQSIYVDGSPAPRLPSPPDDRERMELPRLDERELSTATSWAEAIAEAALAGGPAVEALLETAVSSDWRTSMGIGPAPSLLEHAIAAIRRDTGDSPTVDALLATAGRLRRTTEPAAVVMGTLLGMALEQRLFAEVRAGRLPPEALDVLSTSARRRE